MSRKYILHAVAVALIAGSAQSVAAQVGFGLGYTDFGPTIGLGGIGSASLSFGGRFEHGLRQMPELGKGVIGIGVGASYYSWSSSGNFSGTAWSSSVRYIPVGVTANYHFPLENSQLDPFLGLGLGYSIVSSSCNYSGAGFSYDCGNTSTSAVYFIGRAGLRYHLDRLALYADAGAGDATLNVGVMFRASNGR